MTTSEEEHILAAKKAKNEEEKINHDNNNNELNSSEEEHEQRMIAVKNAEKVKATLGKKVENKNTQEANNVRAIGGAEVSDR